jgi:uncharacterized protein
VQRIALAVLACVLAAGVAMPTYAQAPDEQTASGAAYVTPFPPGDVYKLQVYGDGFADNLLAGLADQARTLERVEIPRKHRAIAPLVRSEAEDEIRAEDQSREVVHIGAVVLGLNDRGNLRVAGANAIRFGSTAWREAYGQRVDQLLKALKRRNIAVYVLGMPPLRRAEANADAEAVNEILLERAQANGIRFVEVAESFTDENGSFSQFGPDVTGNREKLRDGDGVGFTTAGNRKLASLLIAELKRDLAAARAERAVPLAGSEGEQRRINPEKAAAAAWKGVVSKDGKDTKDARTPQAVSLSPALAAATAAAAARPAIGQGDQRSDNGKLALKLVNAAGREEATTVEIVRPPIPAAVIALLNRKEAAEASAPAFEMLAEDVGDGISVSTMVSALPDAAGPGKRRGVQSQSVYNAVWVRGERLVPKPGRADDFSWPRPDAVALPAAPTEEPISAIRGPAARRATIPEARSQLPRSRPLPKAGPDQKG